ncbi:MAG: hypothetical protein ACR2PI_25435 [Hyphomicrobiaceae bacterium]
MMQLYVPSPAPPNGTDERELEILWVRFTKLQRMRREIMADFDIDEAPPDCGRNAQRHADAGPVTDLDDSVFAPIAEELRALAYRAAKITAKRPEDLEYKAVMLSEFLGPRDDSVQTILATSLVMDIRQRRQLANDGHGDGMLGGHHAHDEHGDFVFGEHAH